MDRHEYEINQLINPKKDIVKSNSKHRDKIETLIQGRRVGGIKGGEEPPEQTKWKRFIDYLDSWIYCETRGDNILILPKNVNGETPIVQNGKVVNFMNYSEETINVFLVTPLNEKGYNVPSSGWLEELTTLTTGDDVPNWNEYQEL